MLADVKEQQKNFLSVQTSMCYSFAEKQLSELLKSGIHAFHK